MKTGQIFLIAALVVVGTATFVHFRLTDATIRRALETAQIEARTAERVSQVEALDREAVAVRQNLSAVRAPAPIPPAAPKPTARSTASIDTKILAAAKDPELRKLHVQAYVNQRRLAFAGVIKKSGATPEILKRFDEIHANYQQGLLNSALTAAEQGWRSDDPRLSSLRSQLATDRNAQCETLFADQREAWLEANHMLGAREVVNQIIQQNVQGAGGYSESQADQLTHLLSAHRLDPNAAATTNDPTGYDWEAVLKSVATMLSPVQLEGFHTSVKYYQAQARMNSYRAR